MARSPSLRRTSRPGLLRRLVGVIVAVLVLLLGALVVAAKHVLPEALERLAAARGVPLQVGGAEVAWVEGRVTLLDARLGDPAFPSLAWDAIELGWAWDEVLAGRLELDRFTLRGVRVDVDALTGPGGGVGTLVSWLATLDDLELGRTHVPWLTGVLDTEVHLEWARCRALAELAAGEEGQCQLALRVGAAPVRMALALRVDDESMRYDARVDADALELERWQALLAAGVARPVGSAAADLRARIVGSYAPQEGLVDASGEVTLAVPELVSAIPGASIDGSGILWRGSLDAGWSSTLGLVVGRARGDLEAARLTVRALAGPLTGAQLDVEDLGWRGGVDLVGAAPALEGALQARAAVLTPPSGTWRAELGTVSARGGLQGGASSLLLDSVGAGTLSIESPELGAVRGLVLEGLALEGVTRDEAGAWHAARLAARSLLSTGTVEGPGGVDPVARLPELGAVGVTLAAGGRLEALRFEAPRMELHLGPYDAELERVVADGFVVDPDEGLLARRLSADRLEEVGDGHRMVHEALLAESVALRAGGAGTAREKRVARATIEFDDAGTWTLEDLRSYALRWTEAGASAVDEVSVGTLGFAGSGRNGSLESLVTRSLAISADGRLVAEEAHAAALSIDGGGLGSWRARELRLTGPDLEPGARLETRRVQLDELSVSGAGDYDWTLEGLAIDRLGATSLEHFDADALVFASTRFASATAESRLDGLSARAVRWRPGARLLLEESSLERSELRIGDRTITGTRYRATQGEWGLPLAFKAQALEIERYSGVEPNGLEWAVEQLAARAFRFDEVGDYGAIVADEARMAAVTVDVPPTASARFEAPRVTQFQWVLGELPVLGAGRVGASGGRAGHLEWRVGSVAVTGRGDADRSFDSMRFHDLHLHDSSEQVELAAFDLRIEDGRIPRWPFIEASAFEVDGLRAGRVDAHGLGQLTVAWLRGTDASAGLGEHLDLGEVVLSDLDVRVGIDAEGRRMFPLLDPRRAGLRPSRVRVGRLSTEGGASIGYVDHSVSPPVDLYAEPVNGVLLDFNTARPDRPGEFEIRARGENAGTVAARGIITPSFDTLDVDAEVSVRGLYLRELSPWAVKHHSTRITGGRLDLDLDLRVEARAVSGQADVLIDSLALAPPEREGRPGSYGDHARDIGGTLGMLEDIEGRIHLEVPFSGTLDDPDFRFSGVLARAIGNTATNTVMLALKPVGLIAGELLSGSRFPSLEFEPGEVSLSATDLVVLDDLSHALEERPRMQIRLCGKAGPVDRDAIQQAFSHPGRLPVVLGGAGVTPSFTTRGLARRRADSARGWLLGSERVQAGQLPACEPEVEDDPEAMPRVEIVLASAPPEAPAPPLSREELEQLAR